MKKLKYTTYREIMMEWGNIDLFSSQMKIKTYTALGWIQRKSIPAMYWPRLIKISKKMDFSITFEDLAEIAALKLK